MSTDRLCQCGAPLLDGGPVGLYCSRGLKCSAPSLIAPRQSKDDRIAQLEAEVAGLRAKLSTIRDYAEASYWELRYWLDNNSKLEWTHGDDGPAYPFLRIAKAADAAMRKEPSA